MFLDELANSLKGNGEKRRLNMEGNNKLDDEIEKIDIDIEEIIDND